MRRLGFVLVLLFLASPASAQIVSTSTLPLSCNGTNCTLASGLLGFGNPVDVAFGRNTASVMEINTGTAGVFAALKISNLTASGTVQGQTLFASGDSGGVASNTALTNVAGFGNGVAGQAVTTTLKNTGTGPTTPQTVVNYVKVYVGTTAYYIPLMQ